MYIFRDELLFFGLLIGLTEFIMARIMILRNFPSSFWGISFLGNLTHVYIMSLYLAI